MTPFFSILVPTRDRPELVRYCLESLKLQTFPDFEVIVSDNYSRRSCKRVFDEVADARFHYVTPSSQLSMADNWEFASHSARGQYIGVLIDKTVLVPSALETVSELVRKESPEIVSWWNEGYLPDNEAAGYDFGTYRRAGKPCDPEQFDPTAELQRRFRMDVRRGQEGKHYYWGKICFGVYHCALVERIKLRMGRLFLPISPDYTSMLAALGLARSAIDLGRPLLISFESTLSNGVNGARNPAFAKNFFMTTTPEVIEALPLPGLYTSHHNSVAYDYLHVQRKVGERLGPLRLNRDNLILRAMEDLQQQQWNTEEERLEQYDALAACLKSMPPIALIKFRLTHMAYEVTKLLHSVLLRMLRLFSRLAVHFPGFRKLAKNLLLKPGLHVRGHTEHFESIIAAADAASKYYGRYFAQKNET